MGDYLIATPDSKNWINQDITVELTKNSSGVYGIHDLDNDQTSLSEGTLTDVVSTENGLELNTVDIIKYDFEDGTLQGWVNDSGNFNVVSSPTNNGNYSAGESVVDEVVDIAHVSPGEISGGEQVEYIQFYYRENGDSHGGGILIEDSNGNPVIGVAADNPEWDIYDANGWQANVRTGEPYDRWYKVKIIFNWSEGTADIEWTDRYGVVHTYGDRPLVNNTNVETLRIKNYASGAWVRSAFYMWFDDISICISSEPSQGERVHQTQDLSGAEEVDSSKISWDVEGGYTQSDNIALDKKVTASHSVNAGSLDRLVDGDLNTNNYVGLNASSDCYMEIDLGKVYDVNQIKVWHYYKDNRTYHNTKTEVSEDGVNWYVIFDSSVDGEYVETSSGRTHDFDVRKVRYVRDWINGSTSNTGDHWVEIKVFEAKKITDIDIETNLSLDGGLNWLGWEKAVNGKYINGLDGIFDYDREKEDFNEGILNDTIATEEGLKLAYKQNYNNSHGENANGSSLNVESIEIESDGWYKVNYQTRFHAVSANDRHIMKTWVEKNNEYVTPSETRCYVRNTSNGDSASNSATFFIQCNEGDVLDLLATKDHGASGTTDIEDDAWFIAQKVNNEIAQIYDSSGGQNYDSSTITVNMDSDTVLDSIYSRNSDTLVINENGWYWVYYTVNNHNTGQADRQEVQSWILKNGSTKVIPSDSYSYIRDTGNGDQNHQTGIALVYFNSGDYIELKQKKRDKENSGTSVTIADRNWIALEKVDDNVDMIQVYNSTGNQSFSTSWESVNFDSQTVSDSIYSHDYTNNDSVITVNKSGLYKIAYQFSWLDDGSSNRFRVQSGIYINSSRLMPSLQMDYTCGYSVGRTNSNTGYVYTHLNSGDNVELKTIANQPTYYSLADSCSLTIVSIDNTRYHETKDISSIGTLNSSEISWQEKSGLGFDGVDDYISVADISFSSDFTIEINMKFNNLVNDSSQMFLGTYPNQGDFIRVVNNTDIEYAIGGDAQRVTWSNVNSSSDWQDINQISITRQGTTLELFVDGVSYGTKTTSSEYTTSFSTFMTGWDNSNHFTNAFLHEIRFWNIKRSSSEIQNNINSTLTGDESGLVALYRADEGSGTTLTDYAGSNNGTINGAGWLDVQVESSINGGSSWSICTNGGTIPGLTNGTDVSNTSLDIRTTLIAEDASVTPVLEDIEVEVLSLENQDVSNALLDVRETLTTEDISITPVLKDIDVQIHALNPIRGYAWSTSTSTPSSWNSYIGPVTQSSEGEWYLHSKTIYENQIRTEYYGLYQIDKTSPVNPNVSVNSKSDNSVTLTWSNGDSGGSGFNYSRLYIQKSNGTTHVADIDIDGDGDTEYSLPVGTSTSYTVTGLEGYQDYRYYVRNYDNAGNVNNDGYYYFTTDDGTAPSISVDNTSRAWDNTDVSVTITATDDMSGMATLEYTWYNTDTADPDGGWTSISSGSTVTQTKSGKWYLWVRSTDNVSNSITKTYGPYEIDKQSNFYIDYSSISRSWGNTDVSVDLSYSTYATFDGSTFLDLKDDGSYLNNDDDYFKIQVRIRPTTLNTTSSNHSIQNCFIAKSSDESNDNFELGITSTGYLDVYFDCLGADSTIHMGDGSITTDNWYDITVEYNAGTVTATINGTTYTDSSTWSASTGIDGANGSPVTLGGTIHSNIFFNGDIDYVKVWDNSNTLVTDIQDIYSSLDSMSYSWSISNTTPSSWLVGSVNTTTTQSNEGQWYLHSKITDVVGNSYSKYEGLYKIDKTNPNVSWNMLSRDWDNTVPDVISTNLDDRSGLTNSNKYAITNSTTKPSNWLTDDSPSTTYFQSDLDSKGDGEWYCHVEVTDLAGNSTWDYVGPFKIDRNPPSIPSNLSINHIESGYGVVISWDSSSDPYSGVKEYRYAFRKGSDSYNNNNYTTVTSVYISGLLEDEVYDFAVLAIDNVGNASDWRYNRDHLTPDKTEGDSLDSIKLNSYGIGEKESAIEVYGVESTINLISEYGTSALYDKATWFDYNVEVILDDSCPLGNGYVAKLDATTNSSFENLGDIRVPLSTISVGDRYTLSWWFKGNNEPDYKDRIYTDHDANEYMRANKTWKSKPTPDPNKWQYYEVELEIPDPSPDTFDDYWLVPRFWYHYSDDTSIGYFSPFQLEEKSYATQFVDGVRSEVNVYAKLGDYTYSDFELADNATQFGYDIDGNMKINDDSNSQVSHPTGASGDWLGYYWSSPQNIGKVIARYWDGDDRIYYQAKLQYSHDTTNGSDGTWYDFNDYQAERSWRTYSLQEKGVTGIRIIFGDGNSTNNYGHLKYLQAYGNYHGTNNLYHGEYSLNSGDYALVEEHEWDKLTADVATGNMGRRYYVYLADLIDGESYRCSCLVYNPMSTTVTVRQDWCDTGTKTIDIAPYESKRIEMVSSRSTYSSIYKFYDVSIASNIGDSIWIKNPVIEKVGLDSGDGNYVIDDLYVDVNNKWTVMVEQVDKSGNVSLGTSDIVFTPGFLESRDITHNKFGTAVFGDSRYGE